MYSQQHTSSRLESPDSLSIASIGGGSSTSSGSGDNNDSFPNGRRSSHGGDAVDLDVAHRTLAVSADHLLAVDNGRLRGDALQPVLGDGAAAVARSAGPPRYQAQQAPDREEGDGREAEVDGRQPQEDRAVGEGLVVARGTVADAVAPKRGVDAGVELRAALLAVAAQLVAGERRRYRWPVRCGWRMLENGFSIKFACAVFMLRMINLFVISRKSFSFHFTVSLVIETM